MQENRTGEGARALDHDPSRRTILTRLLAGGAAAPIAALASSPANADTGGGELLAMGRRLRAMEHRHNELDEAWLAMRRGRPEKDVSHHWPSEDLFSDAMDLQDEVLMMPARTVGDVAAQAAALLAYAEKLRTLMLTEQEMETNAGRMMVALASVARWAVQVGRLDPDEVGYDGLTIYFTIAKTAEEQLRALDVEEPEALA